MTVTETQAADTRERIDSQRAPVAQLEAEDREKQRPERPYSALAKARHQLGVLERRLSRLAKKLLKLNQQLLVRQRLLDDCQAQQQLLQRRLEQFEAEDHSNRCPIEAVFCLDAGFGTRENVALLIEMGYEVYIKPYGHWLLPRLKRWAQKQAAWTTVGQNAEMVAWQAVALPDFPYPLDVALQRFHTGETRRHAALIHFVKDPVTTDLPGWFYHYNARQTIEAGIKEGKNVFAMHHLKVRSAFGLYLQEQFAVFAANFVRWAAHWLATQCPQLPLSWQDAAQPKVKEMVKVAAHTSAWVSWQEQGCLLKFTDHSLFAGRSLQVERRWVLQSPLPFSENAHFGTLCSGCTTVTLSMCKRDLFKTIPLIALVVVGGWLVRSAVMAQSSDSSEQALSVQSSANLLVNGSMEGDYYWRYPNHYIAPGWIRWWIHGSNLPEYDLTRGVRASIYYDGERAQVHFIWGKTYTAGIYQVVTGLTPCVPYRLTMWVRNHSLEGALPHARIGLDPQGTQLTPSDDDCAVKNGLPPLTVWSEEQTALFEWEELTVEAEPLGNRLTAILYAAPRPASNTTHYYDTFWDAGRLVELPFPDGRLPEPPSWTPSGFIQNLQATILLDTLLITWDTPQPASTQVWYQITGPRPPRSLSETAQQPASMVQEAYPLTTTLDTTPVTQHRVLIEGLKVDDTVSFVALSRRPTDAVCVTEVSDPGLVVISDPDVLEPDSWAPSGFIQNLSARVSLDRLVITWETPEPSVAQVRYEIIRPSSSPFTSSGTLSYTTSVYLPLVVSGFGGSPRYSLFTPLDLTRSTYHKVVIEGLSVGDTVRFVALSGRIVDYRLVTDVSAEQRVTVPDRVPPPASWDPSGVVQNLVITSSFGSLTVGWDTPGFSSTTQVWYNVLPPATPPTGTLVYTFYVYLPLVMSGSQDRRYQFATPLDLRRTTSHQTRIENLPDGAIVNLVALSSDVVNDSVITEVSAPVRIEVDTSLNGRVYPLLPGP